MAEYAQVLEYQRKKNLNFPVIEGTENEIGH